MTRSNCFQWSLMYCLCCILAPVYISLCTVLSFTPFFSLLFVLCWDYLCLTALLQISIRFPPVISSSSKENRLFLWLLLVKAPSLALLPQANQERIWSDLLIFLNFIHSVVRFPLVCVSGKQYEMGTEKNPVAAAACAWRMQNEVMWNGRLGQCVIGCSNTMCFLTPGSLSSLFTFSFHSYDWYAFLILFSLGLNPPRPSYSFFFLLHFIYIASVTARYFTEAQSLNNSLYQE